MVRLSNLVVTLNFLTFLLSIPIISAGIWLAVQEKSDCEYFLRWPVICLGIFLMFVSLVGFIAACFRVKWLLCLYLFVMFFLIVLLLCFTVVAFVVTRKGPGHSVEKNGSKEYRLEDYSKWLQKQVEKSSNWNTIGSCIRDSKVCKNFTGDSQRKFSAIQSGCCKPPTACGFHPDNDGTHWYQHTRMNASKDSDCKIWSYDENKLCYDCNSCRASVVASVKNDWQNIALVDVVVLIALVVVYSIACCALKSDERAYDRFGHKRYP